MSQEPPRVVKPLETSPQHVSTEQTRSGLRAKPNSKVGRYLVVAGVSLVLLMFVCSGAAFFTYRKFNADSNFGGSYAELREPMGGNVSGEIRDVLREAKPAVDDETREIEIAIDEYSLEVDISRFVMEMQRSGASGGTVNPFTRPMWKAVLNEAIVPPEFGEINKVLSFEWLVPNVEARVVVACVSEFEGADSVYVLYLKRSEETWKLFDWRDVLSPMSESQYWAIYTKLPEPADDWYSDFSLAASEIAYQFEVPRDERVKKLMARYNQVKFPEPYVNLSKDLLCSYLVMLEAKEELAAVTASLTAEDFLGVLHYKATLADWSGDSAKAFEYLSELNAKIGWHPRVTLMASAFAKTPEQKTLAAEWLQRTLIFAPGHTPSVQGFFSTANNEQCKALVQKISETDEASSKLLKIFEAMDINTEAQLQWLIEQTQNVDTLRDASEYFAVNLAMKRKDYAEVVRLAPKVISLPCLNEGYDSYLSHSAWGAYVFASAKTGTLQQAVAQVEDKSKFWQVLRDRDSFPPDQLSADQYADFLKQIPQEEELWNEWQTPLAISRSEREQGKNDEAFERMLAAYEKHKSDVNEDESGEMARAFLSELGEAALACNRWRELEGKLDNEVLFLVLASVAKPMPDRLQEVIAWYEGNAGRAELWLDYYRATLAFARGDWPTADQGLVQAIARAKADTRVTEDSLPSLVKVFMPLEYMYNYDRDLIESWSGMRLSFAARSETLDRLLASVQAADEFDAEWFESFALFCKSGSAAAMERTAALLRSSELAEVQQAVLSMDASIAGARGDYLKSLELEMKLIRELVRDSSEQNGAVRSAGRLMLLIGKTEQLDSLRQLARGTKMAEYVECVAATLEGDASGLCRAIEDWKDTDWGDSGFIADQDVLRRLAGAGVLREVAETHPIDLQWLGYTLEEAILVLSEEPEAIAEGLRKFAESRSWEIEPVEASRFDQVTDACTIKMPNGKVLVTIGAATADAFSEIPLNALVAKEANARMSICLQDFDGIAPAEQQALRASVIELIDGLPSAIAFQDPVQSTIFCGDGWKERLKNAKESAIDLSRPADTQMSIFNYESPDEVASEGLIERDGKFYAMLGAGNLHELIPVTVAERDTPWKKVVATTLDASILVPSIQAGVIVDVSSDF